MKSIFHQNREIVVAIALGTLIIIGEENKKRTEFATQRVFVSQMETVSSRKKIKDGHDENWSALIPEVNYCDNKY